MAYRIAYLLEKKELSPSIVALTFSNKARQELKNRIEEFIPNSHSINVHTFHSFCSYILRTYGQDQLGILVTNRLFTSQFSIVNEQDSLRFVKKILKQSNITHLKEENIFNQITQLKEKVVTEWTQNISSSSSSSSSSSTSSLLNKTNSKIKLISSSPYPINDPIILALFESYEQLLRNNNAADFSDLLILTWKLLRQYPQIRQLIQNQYKHILIDEYQDTNLLQYELTKLLYQPPSIESLKLQTNEKETKLIDSHDNNSNNLFSRSLFVVGDVNQSIYSWRGALPENLTLLEKDFNQSSKKY